MHGHKVFKGIVEDRNDPLKLGRVRVRVIGYHTENKTDIPTELLPWASVMQPTISAAMNGIGHSPLGPVEGTTVLLIFNDEMDMQDPIIIGCIGGIPQGPNFATLSDTKTTPEQQKAVFTNDQEPVQQVAETGGRQVDMLIIHCTATKPNQDIGAADVDIWHRERGWNGIGYHAVIRRNGVVEQGRDLSRMGAHARGFNQRSIGIALVGGIDENGNPQNNFTSAQFAALRDYVGKFMDTNPGAKVIGHNQVSTKACPSFDVPTWLANNFDDAVADDGFLSSYNEEDQIDGTRLEDAGENETDVGKAEGFSDDVVAGVAEQNQTWSSNGLGFNDPNGVYPRTTHVGEADTNRLARNEQIDQTIVQKKLSTVDMTTSAFGAEITEPGTPYAAQYPFNHVHESESGHVHEVDDSPNAERLHKYHRTGTFEEIHPNGTRVTKIVGDDYLIVNQDGNVYVKGNVNITVDGNTNVKVNGATNIESVGNITAHTDSNFLLTADGRIDILAEGRMRLVGSRIDLNP